MMDGLARIGAPLWSPPSAPAASAPAPKKAGEVPVVQPNRATRDDPRGRILEDVLAERGLTQGDLMRLSGQARIEAEVDVHQEVARRMRQTRLLDIRV